MNDEYEKPSPLDTVERTLNSPNQNVGIRPRKPLREVTYNTPRDWEHPQVDLQETPLSADRTQKNWFVRFFIIALVFFLGAAGFAAYKFFIDDGIDASDVDILVTAPLTIGAGETLNFETVIQNRNQIGMRYVDVEILFPEGTRSVQDIGNSQSMLTDEIETIAIGESVKRNYGALLFGEESEKKEITVMLTYQVDGSTTLYTKEKKFDIVIRSTPVRLTITNVKEITSGQELAFTIELVSNSTQTLKDVMVQATYPFGFSYKSSSIAAEADKRTWIIPTLEPKGVVTFDVKGIMDGQNSDDRFFDFSVGLRDPETGAPEVVFSTKGTTVAIARPFLELDLTVDEEGGDVIVVDPEKTHTAFVTFKNNTNFPLRNASITLKIEGVVIDENRVQPSGGFFQSANDTVTWDNTTSDKLISIPVGTSGNHSFTFAGLGQLASFLGQNPEATFTVNVRANRNPENAVPELIENSIVKKIRFNTQASVKVRTEHYTGTFPNSGPIPPKAEQKTSYTGVIELRNTTNAIENGVATMRIPNYVQYEGAYAPSGEKVSYDSVTRTLSWTVGTLPAKTGYGGTVPRTLSVQVSIIPSISQAGSAPVLIENIQLNGTDSHTRQSVILESDNITTRISDGRDYYDGIVSR